RLNLLIQRLLLTKKNEFDLLTRTLQNLNPLALMDKGYSISRIDDKIIRNINEVTLGKEMITQLQNGYIKSTITEVKNNGKQ
ncbi:MAG TPA: hypothetical protein IAD46_02945, partial [Candidatus Pelethenecus faecipullorum]|nr:hypothetical protein [Candidatus Pelethenecus faecipullorum]